MQDVDKLRQRLIDRQTVIDQAVVVWADGMSYGQSWTF